MGNYCETLTNVDSLPYSFFLYYFVVCNIKHEYILFIHKPAWIISFMKFPSSTTRQKSIKCKFPRNFFCDLYENEYFPDKDG